YASLHSNTSGNFNTTAGYYALYTNTAGSLNTAIGFDALNYNTIGESNIAAGPFALFSNTTASENTAIGLGALYTQSYNPGIAWSSGNTAIGYNALFANQPLSTINGINNTAVGHSSLHANSTGWDNTAVGVSALYSNTTGWQNTALGRQALFYNIEGDNNNAIGFKALRQNTSGNGNTAIGDYSLYTNNIGEFNAAIGYNALYDNTTGSYNTACGDYALSKNMTGHDNTSIGFNSGTAIGATNLINTVNIGNNGYLNQASNQDFIGNLSTAWIGGQTTWFTYASDARVKNNVQDDVKGLDFISRLRPVTYNLDITAMREITGNEDTKDYPEKYDIEKIKQSGFLAQEVEQAATASGYNFNGFTRPKTDKELYTMSYSLFVVPLVKAVQELSQENTQLKTALNLMKSENENLSKRIENIESILGKK
ncbi:MAG: tail fiber domain-containing protein, partial [Saprospiraceae bacterium]